MNVILISGGVPEDSLPIAESVFYSHEYVHALQDQHFDLEAYQASIVDLDNYDLAVAHQALVEGDARSKHQL